MSKLSVSPHILDGKFPVWFKQSLAFTKIALGFVLWWSGYCKRSNSRNFNTNFFLSCVFPNNDSLILMGLTVLQEAVCTVTRSILTIFTDGSSDGWFGRERCLCELTPRRCRFVNAASFANAAGPLCLAACGIEFLYLCIRSPRFGRNWILLIWCWLSSHVTVLGVLRFSTIVVVQRASPPRCLFALSSCKLVIGKAKAIASFSKILLRTVNPQRTLFIDSTLELQPKSSSLSSTQPKNDHRNYRSINDLKASPSHQIDTALTNRADP